MVPAVPPTKPAPSPDPEPTPSLPEKVQIMSVNVTAVSGASISVDGNTIATITATKEDAVSGSAVTGTVNVTLTAGPLESNDPLPENATYAWYEEGNSTSIGSGATFETKWTFEIAANETTATKSYYVVVSLGDESVSSKPSTGETDTNQ